MSADSEKSTATPSTDPIRESANLWLFRDDQGKLHETDSVASGRATKRTGKTVQSPHVQRLAADLGLNAEEVAKRIPEDTLRRTKYPMIATNHPDGTTSYEHDRGIVEGRRSLLSTDRQYEDIPRGSGGRGHDATSRDDSGRFSK